MITAAACDNGDDGGPSAIAGGFDSGYRSSGAFFTQTSGLIPGSSPHGDTQIWYSTNIRSLVQQASFSAPTGTTAIKEFDMDQDGTVDGIAVMVKQGSGYDSDNNDWRYEMRDAGGALMADPPAGPIDMCIGCHVASRSTDFLAGTKLR
jgi:hypothetical protein